MRPARGRSCWLIVMMGAHWGGITKGKDYGRLAVSPTHVRAGSLATMGIVVIGRSGRYSIPVASFLYM